MARDGLELRPDLVISFSGVQDLDGGFANIVPGTLFLNKYQRRMWESIVQTPNAIPDTLYIRNLKEVFYGMSVCKETSEVWVENERKMHALCHEFGIGFLGCLQPMITQGNCIVHEDVKRLLDDSGFPLVDYEKEQGIFVEKAKALSAEYEFIIDMTNIFNDKSDVFVDYVHYS